MQSIRYAALAFFLAACGGPQKYDVSGLPSAPGADGHIKADIKKDQRQTLVNVEIEHLAPPSRVAEGASEYIVWYRRDVSEAWSRVGALSYNEGDREAKFQGSVPEVAFELQVTAEPSSATVSPSPTVVLNQRVADD